jgi:hypothetical protein
MDRHLYAVGSNGNNIKIAMWCLALLMLLSAASATARADETPGPGYVPYHSSGIYALGETVGWNVTLPWEAVPATYVIRKNNLEAARLSRIRSQYQARACGFVLSIKAPARSLRSARPSTGFPSRSFNSQPFAARKSK